MQSKVVGTKVDDKLIFDLHSTSTLLCSSNFCIRSFSSHVFGIIDLIVLFSRIKFALNIQYMYLLVNAIIFFYMRRIGESVLALMSSPPTLLPSSHYLVVHAQQILMFNTDGVACETIR
jgi:hypothetical protein